MSKKNSGIIQSVALVNALSITLGISQLAGFAEPTQESIKGNKHGTVSGASAKTDLPKTEKDSAQNTQDNKDSTTDEKATNEQASTEESSAEEHTAKQEQATANEQTDASEQVANDEAIAQQHFELASKYMAKWQWSLAQLELEETIAHWSNLKIAHRDLSLVCLFQGNLIRAIGECCVVIGLAQPVPYTQEERKKLNHEAYARHYNEGIKLGREGKWQDSANEFAISLKYDPGNPKILHSLAFAYASAGDYKKAEQCFEETFSADPNDAYAHADFAALLTEIGQGDKAVSQLTEAVKLAPDVAALHVDLGWLAEARGDLNTAKSEFQKAAELKPKYSNLWVKLAKVLEQQGDLTGASQAYEKALALAPSDLEIKQKVETLKIKEPQLGKSHT